MFTAFFQLTPILCFLSRISLNTARSHRRRARLGVSGSQGSRKPGEGANGWDLLGKIKPNEHLRCCAQRGVGRHPSGVVGDGCVGSAALAVAVVECGAAYVPLSPRRQALLSTCGGPDRLAMPTLPSLAKPLSLPKPCSGWRMRVLPPGFFFTHHHCATNTFTFDSSKMCIFDHF